MDRDAVIGLGLGATIGQFRRLNRVCAVAKDQDTRSEEHTSELQSRPHISYAVFCLKKKKPPPPPSLLSLLSFSSHVNSTQKQSYAVFSRSTFER